MNYSDIKYKIIEVINSNPIEYSYTNYFEAENDFKNKINLCQNSKICITIKKLNDIRDNIILKELSSNDSIINCFDKLRNKTISESNLVQEIDDFMKNNIYISVISTICHYSGRESRLPDLENEQEWIELISMAIALSNESKNQELNSIRLQSKIFNIFYCISYFKKRGVEVEIDELNNIMFCDKTNYIKIHDELDVKIKNIGGKNLCEIIFSNIKNLYNYEFNMFLITQNPKDVYVDSEMVDLMIPYNYILQLCVKNYSKRNYPYKKSIYDSDVKSILELASCYVGLFSIQKFSKFEDLFITHEELPYFIKSNLMFDRLFTLNQFNYRFITETVLGMFGSIFKEFDLENKLGFSINDYIEVIKCIISLAKNYPTTIHISAIKDELNTIESKKIDIIIDKMCHNKKNINSNFKDIYSKTTFFSRPLISMKSGYVDLVSISWCSFAFVEALFDAIRSINLNINIDTYIGGSLEQMIKHILVNKNIKFKSGYYNQEECDIVLETDTEIFFIEIKKKGITEEARRGNDVKFIEDLAKSLVSSQCQLLKHEYNLKYKGSIILRKSNNKREARKYPTSTITLGNKSIVKVSLSLTDYGFINSNYITRRLLELLSDIKFKAVEEGNNKRIEDTNRYLNKMQSYIGKLINLHSTEFSVRDIFKDTYFISLNQILFYLNEANSVEDLLQYISYNNRIATFSNNPYCDYSILQNIKKVDK